ncbi:UBX domain-containing protein 4 isoform X1 [Cotesia typhae]|uniref:UBX domain-containing protein 4 isoform X1 n=1 Tax=Cotesia typhae TaxID=2053667 RepID=UPI003D693EDA
MKWFPGSINDAVATSKSKNAIFVVFIAGEDDASKETSQVIDTPEVSSSLEKDEFVAIKLESGSESYKFFAQIYQLVPVPSLFFIGDNGKPLEIVAGSVTSSSLKDKIDSVLVKAGKKDSSNNFIKMEQTSAEATVSNTPQTSTSNYNVPESSTTVSSGVNANANVDSSISAEEKIERAKKLIELQKKQRLEQEREKERLREIERREMGKNVQSAKRKQQDLELKLAHEERMKEKAAELEARERIRAQIAQDKIERKQREQVLLQQNNTEERPAVPPPSRAFLADGTARIQFRLPSGNPHTGLFQPTSTLRELRAYVVNNIELPFQQFSMSTSFPRKDLNQEDDDKTLVELELVPTAVVLILPVKNSKPSAIIPSDGTNFISRFMWALFAPLVTVFNYITGYFTDNRGPNDRTNNSRGSTGESRTGGVYSSGSRPNVSQPGSIRRTLGGSSTTVRARGNVHRLYSGDDDDDENNTWNGNSTQQM